MHLTANKHLYYELHSQLNANYSSKKMQSQTSKMLLEKGIGHKDPTRFWKIMDIVSRRLHSARQDIERNKLVEREYLLLNQVELEEESRANH